MSAATDDTLFNARTTVYSGHVVAGGYTPA